MKRRNLLSVKEVAAELGVSADTVRRAYWKGEFPAFRICKTLRFDLGMIHRVMRAKALSAAMKAEDKEVGASHRRKDVKAVSINARQKQLRIRPERQETVLDGLPGRLEAARVVGDFLTKCEALCLLAKRLVFLLSIDSLGPNTPFYSSIANSSGGAVISHTNGQLAKKTV